MAITTYAELQTAVGQWLHRSDLTTVIPTFIALAEGEFSRLQLTNQITTVTLSVSGVSTALPTDWYSVRSVVVNAGGRMRALDYIAEEEVRQYNISGTPKHYSISGENLLIAPTPDGTYDVTLTYYAKVAALSDSNTTNALLEHSPDAYLWRAVYEGAKYTQDLQLAGFAASEYQRIVADLKTDDMDRQFGVGPVMRGA